MKKNAECPHRVARIFRRHPEIQQLRVDTQKQSVEVAFGKELPDKQALDKIHSAVHHEFAPAWEACDKEQETCDECQHHVEADDLFHQHRVDKDIVEFHRKHTEDEPPLIWQKVKLPVWQNRPVPEEHEHNHHVMLFLAAVCGVSTLAGWLLHPTQFAWIAHLCFAIAYVTGAWFPAQEVFEELRKGKIDVHFLMLVVAVGAAFVDALAEGAMLLFLFSLSDALEHWAHHRTQKTIGSLLKSAPKHAVRREGGTWVDAPIEAVKREDELLVKAGELFPVDGLMIDGNTSADESALTGESLPVAKRAGDPVSGGTLNLDGQAVIRVVRLPRESAVQRILALIEHAQQQKAPAQRFTDKFSKTYTWVVLGLSAAMFAVLCAMGKPVMGHDGALYHTMTLLVVASPCALVLSIPSAILVAIAAGARAGILFRGGVAIENLAAVNQFAFDKTGTLTKGHLRVARVEPREIGGEVLSLAASIGQSSTHPLSRAILREAQSRALPLAKVEDFKNISGSGMEARVEGRTTLVGSRRFLAENGIVLPAVAEQTGDAEVCVAGGSTVGVIYLSDEIRPESKEVVEQLRASGANVSLLTGDRHVTAKRIGAQVGIEDIQSELTPDDKLQCVLRWQADGRCVAMVGDGINDAPSLTAADVALAMGARGSDAALEQADVVLMHDKIENVVQAADLSRRARAVIRQNLAISLGVIAILVVSALSQKINLSLGVVGHEGSTVVVVLNGLRLLRCRRRS